MNKAERKEAIVLAHKITDNFQYQFDEIAAYQHCIALSLAVIKQDAKIKKLKAKVKAIDKELRDHD